MSRAGRSRPGGRSRSRARTRCTRGASGRPAAASRRTRARRTIGSSARASPAARRAGRVLRAGNRQRAERPRQRPGRGCRRLVDDGRSRAAARQQRPGRDHGGEQQEQASHPARHRPTLCSSASPASATPASGPSSRRCTVAVTGVPALDQAVLAAVVQLVAEDDQLRERLVAGGGDRQLVDAPLDGLLVRQQQVDLRAARQAAVVGRRQLHLRGDGQRARLGDGRQRAARLHEHAGAHLQPVHRAVDRRLERDDAALRDRVAQGLRGHEALPQVVQQAGRCAPRPAGRPTCTRCPSVTATSVTVPG